MKRYFNLRTKLRAFKMAKETGNKKKTAKKFNVDLAQVSRWLKNKEKIIEYAKNSTKFNDTNWSEVARQRIG